MLANNSTSLTLPVLLNDLIFSLYEVKKYVEFELFGINTLISKYTYFMFNILKRLTVALGDLNIFHWLLLLILIWSLIYPVFSKCMQLLLRRVGVEKQDHKHLIETVWHLCFTAISIPVILNCIGGSLLDTVSLSWTWLDRLEYQLSKCKIHDDITVPGTKTVFVLHCSFTAHDIINTWYHKGFKNLEFLQKQQIFATFIMTYITRCPLLGLSFIFLLHSVELVSLLSKLFCLLSRFTGSTLLRYSSRLLAFYNVLLWCGMFFYTIPSYLMNAKRIDSEMMKAELKTLIAMEVVLWVYVFTSIFISMFTRIMLSITLPCKERPCALEYYLFGCDPLLLKLTKSKSSEVICQLPNEESETSDNAQDNKRALVQTIRCGILLKRKVRRMRAEKENRLAGRQDISTHEIQNDSLNLNPAH